MRRCRCWGTSRLERRAGHHRGHVKPHHTLTALSTETETREVRRHEPNSGQKMCRLRLVRAPLERHLTNISNIHHIPAQEVHRLLLLLCLASIPSTHFPITDGKISDFEKKMDELGLLKKQHCERRRRFSQTAPVERW